MSSERPRSTRARYVTEAWCVTSLADPALRTVILTSSSDECRRRKIRCNGQQPCSHCDADQALACVYTQKRRARRRAAAGQTEQVNRLTEQVGELQRQIDSHLTSTTAAASPVPPSQVRDPHAATSGSLSHHQPEATQDHTTQSTLQLTNPEYAVGMAGRELQSNGNTASGRPFLLQQHTRPFASNHWLATMVLNDPLQNLALPEIMRLVHVFNSGPGAVYPVIGSEELLSAARAAKDTLQGFAETGRLPETSSLLPSFSDASAVELKLVLATASALESCGANHFTRVVFDNIQPILQGFFFDAPILSMIRVWFLVGQLLFHVDQGLQASRTVAHAARLCQELGLHRPHILHAPSQDRRQGSLANKLVWSIFALDRRSAIDLGIPYVLQDCSIEICTPVENDEDLVYLRTLCEISQISGQVYHTAAPLSDRDASIPADKINEIDERLLQWHHRIRNQPSLSSIGAGIPSSRSRLAQAALFRNAVLYLRGNQSRNLLYRPVLYGAARIATFPEYTHIAVDTALEAINLLATLIATQDMAQRNALLVKHFLLTAFSSLVLVVSVPSADPTITLSEGTCASVREAFGSAVELARLLHERSSVFDSLWDTVQRLETLAKRCHFWSSSQSGNDPETTFPSRTENAHVMPRTQTLGGNVHVPGTSGATESHQNDGLPFEPAMGANDGANADFMADSMDIWPQLSWDPALMALNANWAYA